MFRTWLQEERRKSVLGFMSILFILSLLLFYTNSSASLFGPYTDEDGIAIRGILAEQQVIEKGDDFGTPPDDIEEPPVSNVFSNKIVSPPLHYDESNPQNFTYKRNGGIHLITTFFKGTYHKARISELIETLRRNIKNEYIEAVHVIYEKDNPRKDLEKTNVRDLLDRKLVTMRVQQQPTYFRMFTYANLALDRGSIAIVANSDIFFDKTLRHLKFGAPRNETNWRSAMALSRSHAADCGKQDDWNGVFDLCNTYIGSHDAFIFAPPAPDFVLKNSKHTQNHFGAENIIVFGYLWARGFRGHISNPCKRIKAMHLHCVQERHYEIGSFISGGRHGNIRPGIKSDNEESWNLIY
jgi:hypothetical protein